MPVYLAVNHETQTVKIGFSYVPAERVRNYSWARRLKFEIVRLVDGDLSTEKWFHRRFADRHTGPGREVFAFSTEMLTVQPPAGLPPSILHAGVYFHEQHAAPEAA